jgi:hypothetical protein
VLELIPQLIDLLALLADDQAWARRVDNQRDPVRRALDLHAGQIGVLEPLPHVVPDREILAQVPLEVLVIEPPRAPWNVEAEAEADRMCLLTHAAASFPPGVAATPVATPFAGPR